MGIFKKKKKYNYDELKSKELAEKDELVKELQEKLIDLEKDIQGYFNQEYILKSKNITNYEKDNFKSFKMFERNLKVAQNSLFRYKNLPDEIKPELIERYLFTNGKIVFFEFNETYRIAQFSNEGSLDVYKEPTTIRPIFENGTKATPKKVDEDCVIIYNDLSRLSTLAFTKPILEKLFWNWVAQEQKLRTSLTKWLFKVDGNDKKTVADWKAIIQRLLNKSGYVEFIDNIDFNKFEKFEMYEDYDPEKYWDDFMKTYDFLFNQIGIFSNSNEKRERMVVDEVNINKSRTSIILENMFEQRKQAIDKINEIFNLDIQIEKAENDILKGVENKEEENKDDDFEN